jgi:hypothetical protein
LDLDKGSSDIQEWEIALHMIQQQFIFWRIQETINADKQEYKFRHKGLQKEDQIVGLWTKIQMLTSVIEQTLKTFGIIL